MKKITKIVSSFCFFTLFLQAENQDAQFEQMQSRVYALEETKEEIPYQITPSAAPISGYNFFITAEFLYWYARETGLAYSIKAIQSEGDPGSFLTFPRKVEHMDWHWDQGFRAGLGLGMPHDGWDIYANWTYFFSKAGDTSDVASVSQTPTNGQKFYLPSWSLPFGSSEARVTRGRWSLNFNTIDLELGRNLWISHFLSLRPFIGVRVGTTVQRYHLKYIQTLTLPTQNVQHIRYNQRFRGVGFRSGLNSKWHFTSYFSLYGEGAISLLYGKFQIKDRNRAVRDTAPIGTFQATFDNTFNESQPIFDYALGLALEGWFCQERVHLELNAGWEQHLWFNQNRLMKIVVGSLVNSSGNLSLSGIVLRLRLDW